MISRRDFVGYLTAGLFLALAGDSPGLPVARFEKVSEHFYYLQSAGSEGNVGAVVTDQESC